MEFAENISTDSKGIWESNTFDSLKLVAVEDSSLDII